MLFSSTVFLRLCAGFFAVCFVARLSAAEDRVAELARIHVEAMGGRKRIEALASFRATGHVTTAGKRVRFTMTAARPDKIRVETEQGGRTLVQASDGVEPPWEFDTGTWPPRYVPMKENVAETFTDDSEFDDPLITGAKRGHTIEYAGELKVGNKALIRLLVTRNFTDNFSILIDPSTYLIVGRVEQRTSAGGRPIQITTRFEDFRPVDGVLLPHAIIVSTDGRVTHETKIEQIVANPKLTDDTFTRPKRPGEPPAKEPAKAPAKAPTKTPAKASPASEKKTQ
jgi:hypothetical protein